MAWTIEFLKSHGSESPRLDTEILLAHARGCQRIELYTNYDTPLSDAQRAVMRDLVQRRAKAEPVAYLVGHREFFGLDFQVDPSVLIPRPDTETVVMDVLDAAKPLTHPRIVDVCTGSGCIAVAVAVNCPQARLTAIDIEPPALSVAQHNAQRHAVADRITFLQGDLLEPLAAGEQFDIIAGNPPYVSEAEFETLQADVRLHEPHRALDGGPDGLAVLRRLIPQAAGHLGSGGRLILEIASEQVDSITRIIEETGDFGETKVLKDLAGRSRVVRTLRR
jgi:release factor glutamine methyltransferase